MERRLSNFRPVADAGLNSLARVIVERLRSSCLGLTETRSKIGWQAMARTGTKRRGHFAGRRPCRSYLLIMNELSQILPLKPKQPNQTGAKEKQGGRYGNGAATQYRRISVCIGISVCF